MSHMSISLPCANIERFFIAFLILILLVQQLALNSKNRFQIQSNLSSIANLPSINLQSIEKTKYAIISMTTDETSYDYYSFNSKDSYAKLHGYDMIWDFKKTRIPKVWDKLNLIENAINSSIKGEKSYEWIWMIDFDTLITNPKIKLESIIEKSLSLAVSQGLKSDEIEMIFAKDCEPINAGVMFFRASPYTLSFIKQWWKGFGSIGEDGRDLNEQEVLWKMLANNELEMKNHSIITPQTWFDAYPKELDKCRDNRDPSSWSPEMFLIHFAGANWFLGKEHSDPVGYLMRKYWRKIQS